MKIFFAPDTSDHPNWGCRIMGAWFRAAFARIGTPPAWITPSLWFYKQHADLGSLDTLADFRRCAEEVRAGRVLKQTTTALQNCDLVYLNGENFIRPGARKGLLLLLLAYLAKTVFEKPCVLSNHSIDLDEPELEQIAREVYPLLDEVHFREETSAERGSALVTRERRRLIPDVAWSVPAAPFAEWGAVAGRAGQFDAWPDSAQGFDPQRPYITVCASSMFALPQHRDVDIAPAFVKLCGRLNAEVGPVVLAAPCEPDLVIMRKVQAALKLPLLGIHLPVRQALDIIGNAAVHVGGRWHPAIFAATGGTPPIALSANSHKVNSLMRQLRMDGPVFDVLKLEDHVDEIVALAHSHIAAGASLRTKLMQRSRELGAQVDGNLDVVRRLNVSAGR